MVTGELVPLRPARVVTSGVGWWLTTRRDGSPGYTNTDLHGRGEPVSMAELIELGVFGRPRPVVPPLPSEAELIRTALYDAGELAVTTLAHALGRCAKSVPLSTLTAGRPESRQSQHLVGLAQWGLRVVRGRVFEAAETAIVRQVLAWVNDSERFVEVAMTLATLFGEVSNRHVDEWLEQYPPGCPDEPNAAEGCARAWTSMADRPLWPDAYEGATVGEEWYRYLMATASMFSTSWFTEWGAAGHARWRRTRL